ncbi:MAG: hypothetical protein IT371_13030 [Deltaproteobacteria bacterium]|nr:hypothetical protein [Deltaproteobacteria bacterium]
MFTRRALPLALVLSAAFGCGGPELDETAAPDEREAARARRQQGDCSAWDLITSWDQCVANVGSAKASECYRGACASDGVVSIAPPSVRFASCCSPAMQACINIFDPQVSQKCEAEIKRATQPIVDAFRKVEQALKNAEASIKRALEDAERCLQSPLACVGGGQAQPPATVPAQSCSASQVNQVCGAPTDLVATGWTVCGSTCSYQKRTYPMCTAKTAWWFMPTTYECVPGGRAETMYDVFSAKSEERAYAPAGQAQQVSGISGHDPCYPCYADYHSTNCYIDSRVKTAEEKLVPALEPPPANIVLYTVLPGEIMKDASGAYLQCRGEVGQIAAWQPIDPSQVGACALKFRTIHGQLETCQVKP